MAASFWLASFALNFRITFELSFRNIKSPGYISGLTVSKIARHLKRGYCSGRVGHGAMHAAKVSRS